MNNKTITILALHLNFGGVEKYISSLCKMLQDNYQINIICTYNNENKTAFEFDKKIKIEYLINEMPNRTELVKALKNKKIFRFLGELLKSIKIIIMKYWKNISAIKKIDSDYIITTRTFHNSLVSQFAKKSSIKIATEHNYHNNNDNYVNKLINSVRKFDFLVVVSRELEQYYLNKKINPKVVYIPNTIDEIPTNKTNLKKNTLISVGRFSSEKGFDDLIRVFDKVHDEIPDSKLVLIGNGYEKDKIKALIDDYNLNKVITLPGFLTQKQIEKYMLNSKLYVMTSFTESFGLVLIEAMRYGVPCIAFDSASGAKQIIDNNRNGLLVSNRSIDEMAKQIIKLLQNDTLLMKYSKNSIKDSQKYYIENVKKEWLKLLSRGK